jgi:hypothetical protein
MLPAQPDGYPPHPQKAASGWPPVAPKNLRVRPTGESPNRRAAERRPPVDPWMEPARNQPQTLPAYHESFTGGETHDDRHRVTRLAPSVNRQV